MAIKVLRQIQWMIWLLMHNSNLGQLLGNCSHLKVKDEFLWTNAFIWVKSVIIWTCRCYLHLLYYMNISTFQRQRMNALQLKPTKRNFVTRQTTLIPWALGILHSLEMSLSGGQLVEERSEWPAPLINSKDTVGSWWLGEGRDLIGE